MKRGAALLLRVAACAVVIALAANCYGQWTSTQVAGPFVCRAEFSLHDYRGLLAELVEIQAELERVLGVPAPREQVDVVLFADEARYRHWLQANFPKLAFRRAMFVKLGGRGTVYAYRNAELAVDLRHECTHGLLHASLSMVPLWLDEGLAEYFEVPPRDRAAGHEHLRSLSSNFRWGGTPPLEKLENKRDLSELSATDYRDAWAWVHYLLHGPPVAREVLVAYLADIHAGAAPGQLSGRLKAQGLAQPAQLAEHIRRTRR